MLGVGVVGAVFLGYIQDTALEDALKDKTEIHQQVVENKEWVFGTLDAVNPEKVKTLTEDEQATVDDLSAAAKQGALSTVAIFPVIMFVCYLILIVYFKSRGGYSAEVLTGHAAHDEEFTGGVEGPVE